jgi:predicted nucleic acid-binding protein
MNSAAVDSRRGAAIARCASWTVAGRSGAGQSTPPAAMIVSDAGPLLAFARIGQLELLRRQVESLVIPEAVAHEISDSEGGAIALPQETWIAVKPVQSEPLVGLLLPTLEPACAEAVALAMEQQARLVLIDDLDARKVAESLGLKVCSSAGLLLGAKQNGDILAVRPWLDEMRRQGVHCDRQLIDAALREAGE